MNDKTYKAAKETLTVLKSEVAVVPGTTVLSDLELVRLTGLGGDGALGDTGNTVVGKVVELTNAMPVNRGAVVDDVIGNVDSHCVTPVGLSEEEKLEGSAYGE
jgi:IS4 transposase